MFTENELKNPRHLLKQELAKRIEKNAHYSLRSFSKSLGISHTVLSLVLSGKRNLSKNAGMKIADSLGLTPLERTLFLMPTKKEKDKSENHLESHDQEYKLIDLDLFYLISDWVHYAILSLLDIDGFKLDQSWIAKRLGINQIQAKLAIERLVNLEIVIKENGKWIQSGKKIAVENYVSTSATRKFHHGLLEKAASALDQVPMELRDFSSITMAINPDDIEYARTKIKQFRRSLAKNLESRSKSKEVYNLTVQIYPVSK